MPDTVCGITHRSLWLILCTYMDITFAFIFDIDFFNSEICCHPFFVDLQMTA